MCVSIIPTLRRLRQNNLKLEICVSYEAETLSQKQKQMQTNKNKNSSVPTSALDTGNIGILQICMS